jgi:hypothetical protein
VFKDYKISATQVNNGVFREKEKNTMQPLAYENVITGWYRWHPYEKNKNAIVCQNPHVATKSNEKETIVNVKVNESREEQDKRIQTEALRCLAYSLW